jgi:hypothetical protein
MFLLDVHAAVSSANWDTSLPDFLGISATHIVYSYGARTAAWGRPARIGFQPDNVPSILTLNLRSVSVMSQEGDWSPVFRLCVACV